MRETILTTIIAKIAVMSNIVYIIFVTIFSFAPFGNLQESQCMRGFLEEDVLRSKAALIGETVSRSQEQVIIPAIKFTCAGSISKWIFIAEQNTGNGRNRYPEIQIWRPQLNSPHIYDIVASVVISPQETSQDNVYTHTITSPISYQAGDVLGLYHPPANTCAYKILSVHHGGPANYRMDRQDRSRTQFDINSNSVRVRGDYPLIGADTDNPQCISGFLSRSVLDTRAGSLSGESRYQAMSNQQRLIPSLTYGCQGKIGRILMAAQDRGTGGDRDHYPEIHVMRQSTPDYYIRVDGFELNQLTAVNSPNVLEFTVISSTNVRPGDVIRIYQPESDESVYQVYHEPGVGPNNYYINGFPPATRTVFPVASISTEDVSQPLYIVELIAKCPTLQNPNNGLVELTDSVAVYECNPGYRLDGPEQRLCNNDTGQWLGGDPQCTLVDCGTPPEVTHGFITLSRGTALGSIATYSCERQYVLSGTSTRRCGQDDQWSGQSPTCKRMCDTLRVPPNGQVSVSNQPVEGDIARFSCYTGYQLIGAVSSTCLANGQWSFQPPTCELIQCPGLPRPGNGVVTINPPDRRIGSTATFRCNAGYEMIGQTTLNCQQNGQWSSQPPTCQLITCSPLGNPLNGMVQVNDREAVYTCNIGYNLVGFATLTCQLNGVWTSPPPTCEPIQCPALYNPPNGLVSYSSRYVGSLAVYTCFPGYHLIGLANTTCELFTGQWSNPPPTCQLIDCGSPPPPQHGYVILLSGQTYFNNLALYSCGTGYLLQGNEQRMCQENGQWSGSVPDCQVDCGQAPDIAHAEVTINGTSLYDVATYHCTTGYRQTGGSQLVCQDQGWNGELPFCAVVMCSRLSQPANGQVVWESTDFNSVATYSCNDGYMLNGVSERVCQASGFWSDRPPYCSQTPLIPTFVTHVSDSLPQPTNIPNRPSSVNDDIGNSLAHTPTPSSLDHLPTTILNYSIPLMSDVPTSKDSQLKNTNVYIVWGMIVLMICLIIVVVLLIIVVYLRRVKMNALAAAAANSVENPLYSGHGGTPLATLNCFSLANEPMPHNLSGAEVQRFSLDSVTESNTDSGDRFGVTNGVHLYDFPSLNTNGRNPITHTHSQEAGSSGLVGHSYEFPDHYHLATQYEVPIASYERPRPQAKLHIYKNTLPADVYVPTLEERQKSVTTEKQQQVLCRTSSAPSPGVAEETMFFAESTIYWKPASDPAGLYEQLSKNKYREISRKYIRITELIGSGQFGQVNRGVWQRPAGEAIDVAIKTLKEGVKEEDRVRFLQEAAISGQFQHPNVVRLQGVVTVGEPIMIILELLPNGDLRNYLLKQRPSLGGKDLDDFWPKQLLNFGRDIASGMNYLSSKAFVHRDLAARNILVAKDHSCKIGDFGMSRDLDEENYYISNGGKIPVKWTAPEALHYKKYSTASDVWSFGCLMYEIWSLGHKPFEKNSNAEAIKMIDQGLRLPPPPGCPRAIYQLMMQCWHPSTASRPTFHVLHHALSRDSRRLLSWSKGDTGSHTQASALGAPLETALELYVDLQRTYIISSSSTST